METIHSGLRQSDSAIEFRILGPVEIRQSGLAVRIGPPKQRLLLAMLLSHPNQAVSHDQLIEEIWPRGAPTSALANLRSYAAGIRQALPAGARHRLVKQHLGYLLEVAPHELDASVFTGLATQAQAAMERSDEANAARLLERAMGLWRGEPLEGVCRGERTAAAAERLAEQRLAAKENLFQARLALGDHVNLVVPLREQVAAHPLRERLWKYLMLALYRAGDSTEALTAYASCRATLLAELGIEPGRDLRELRQDILTRRDLPSPEAPAKAVDQTVTIPRPPVKPRQLPPVPEPLIGHTEALALIRDALAAEGHHPCSPRIVAIHGPAGVGKSALALHAAHQNAAGYPDGQLYLDFEDAPWHPGSLRVEDALARVLRALGQPVSSTVDVAEATAVFRSVVSDRRLLLFCDNVGLITQLRPLLPASSACAVIVTSQRAFYQLENATQIPVGRMSEGDAIDLFARHAGQHRAAQEPEAVREIVRICGRLPLAVKLAGQRLASKGWPVNRLVGRLADARYTLDELDGEDALLRRSFSAGHRVIVDHGRGQNSAAAAVFARLGRMRTSVFTLQEVAAAVAGSVPDLEEMLDRLVTARLLEVVDGGKYWINPLLQLYAVEQASPVSVRA